jgi:cell division protein FtsZ
MPPLQPSVQTEPKKSGGFSVFGITIGGSASVKRPGPSAKASTSPSAARMGGVGSAAANSQAINLMREAGLSKERSEELLKSMSDDQLDIPAFLRRQVN